MEEKLPRLDLIRNIATGKYENFPEEKLVVNMIQLALDDCCSKDAEIKCDALCYIFDKNYKYSHSFDNLCLCVDLNPQAIREYILKSNLSPYRRRNRRASANFKMV